MPKCLDGVRADAGVHHQPIVYLSVVEWSVIIVMEELSSLHRHTWIGCCRIPDMKIVIK